MSQVKCCTNNRQASSNTEMIRQRRLTNSSCWIARLSSFWTKIKPPCYSVIYGQLIACLFVSLAAFSTLLVSFKPNRPLTYNLSAHSSLFTTCFLLGSCCHPLLAGRCRSGKPTTSGEGQKPMPTSSLIHLACLLAIGLIEVHVNWITLSAYSLTNLTSIQLLDCVSIPTALILSPRFLGVSYNRMHYVGAGLSVTGAVMMVIADLSTTTKTTEPMFINTTLTNITSPTSQLSSKYDGNRLYGDLMALGAAVLYGCSCVLQEWFAQKRYSIIGYVRGYALVAFCLNLGYCFTFELHLLRNYSPTRVELGYSVGYTLSFVCLRLATARALSHCSAVFLNISLVTSDVYSMLLGVYLFHTQFQPLYFIAFAIILLGAFVFSASKPVSKSNNHYQPLVCLGDY